MTIENWLTIAAIISTLIAPVLALLIQHLISQPKPTPELNHPKNRIQIIGGWLIRIFQSPWILVGPIFSTVFDIYVLHRELGNTSQITRGVIFLISVAVAAIAFNLSIMNSLLAQQSISRQTNIISKQSDAIAALLDLINVLRDSTKKLAEDLNARIEVLTSMKPPKIEPKISTPKIFNKLLAAIKVLLGD